MRVKTFVGANAEAVDQKINEWLAENDVKVRKTNTAFHRFRDHGEDAITGKATKRRALGIANRFGTIRQKGPLAKFKRDHAVRKGASTKRRRGNCDKLTHSAIVALEDCP
jgi:hypothetical protein